MHLFVFILLIGMRVNIKLLSLPAQLLCLLIRMKVAITISLFFLYSVLLFIVGNPSPRFFRPTIHSIPVDSSFINTTSFPFGLFRFFFFFLYVLKVLLFSHLPISLKMSSLCHLLIMVFCSFCFFLYFRSGEAGPLRCGRCKAYINPAFQFTENGRKCVCNFCQFPNMVRLIII